MDSRLLNRHLANWEDWSTPLQQCPAVTGELGGGLTNRSFLLTDGQTRLVLRLNHPHSERLGIDRSRELEAQRILDDAGVAPRVYFADAKIMVREFVEGRTLTRQDLEDPEALAHLAAIRDTVHALEQPPGSRRFNYTRHLLNYLKLLSAEGMPASELIAFSQKIETTASELDAAQWDPVICHHDLITDNIVRTSSGLVILDWEYAGWGHPMMDCTRLLGGACPSQPQDQADLVTDLIGLMDELWQNVAEIAGPSLDNS